MASFNKVILLGNLTRDPVNRVTPGGMNISSFSVAVNRRYKTKEGETRDEVTFVDVAAFGKQAEVINKFFEKGKPIHIEGRLRLEQWEMQDGQKRSRLSVVLESFQFIGGGKATESTGNGSTPPADPGNDLDEDVPF